MTLSTVPKQFFATALFGIRLVRSKGLTVEDARVATKTLSAALILRDGACLLLKFATLTGNGRLRVERWGLVPAYRGPGDDKQQQRRVHDGHVVQCRQVGARRSGARHGRQHNQLVSALNWHINKTVADKSIVTSLMTMTWIYVWLRLLL
jgi:hypothetical protein